MRATCLTLLPDHPYITQPQLQIFKLLIMHFFQPPVISYMLSFIHKLYGKKKTCHNAGVSQTWMEVYLHPCHQ